MIISLLLITFAGAFTSCIALKTGAPLEACSNLLPKHGEYKPQQVSSPYAVSARSLGNNKIGVMVSSPAGEAFKGFILQARSASNKEKFIPGEFSIGSISRGINCEEHEKSTLTHVNNEPKTEVSTEWTGLLDEDIIFRATVVQDYPTFWINIDSDPVTVEEKELDKKNRNDCTNSDVCVEKPTNCVIDGNCKVLLEFEDNGDESIKFTLSGELKESQYMAMGISKDNRMGDDFVTECVRVGSSEIRLRKSWNKGRDNMNTTDVSTEPGNLLHFVNGKTTCIWNETKIVSFNDKIYDLMTKKPYILLAQGQVMNEGGIRYHDSKVASSEPIDLFTSGHFSLERGDTNPTDGEPDGNQTTESSSNSKHVDEPNSTSSSSQLNFGLFWLAFLGVFYASGRNLLNLI